MIWGYSNIVKNYSHHMTMRLLICF